MKHARPDYDRIQDPDGLIPVDEPVFLLRAQDKAAPATLDVWASIASDLGASPEMVAMAKAHAQAMRAWQAEHADGGKVPDLAR